MSWLGKKPADQVTSGQQIAKYTITLDRLVAGVALASGTVGLFVQSAAPVGWTKSTTHNDKALRVVSGTAGSGGSVAFSTAFSSTTSAGVVGNTSLNDPSLMPSHTHGATTTSYIQGWNTASNVGGATNQVVARWANGGDPIQANNPVWSGTSIGYTGGNGSHNHTFALPVNYVDVIIASKD